MPSEFVTHFTRSLDAPTSRTPSPLPSPSPSSSNLNQAQTKPTTSHKKQALHALLVSLNQGVITTDDIKQATVTLHTASTYESSGNDHEEEVLQDAISAKLTVALYSETLDAFLDQATQVEAEAEWWADVESSGTSVALYLLQSEFFLPALIQSINLLQLSLLVLSTHFGLSYTCSGRMRYLSHSQLSPRPPYGPYYLPL
jgi:nuclear-control-of-ATPase protein 2